MSRKKILIFGPLSSGHIQKWIQRFFSEFDFTVLTLHNTPIDNCKFKTIDVPRLTGTKLDFLYSPFYLLYYIFKINPDIIHVHFLSSYGLFSSITPTRKSIMLSTWGSDVNNVIHGSFRRWVYKSVLNRFCWINTPAAHIEKKILSLNGSVKGRVHTFQYGVDTDFFSSVNSFEKFQGKGKEVRIASIRNWDSIYRVKEFIELMVQCSNEFPDVTFIIKVLGKGSSTQVQEDFLSHLNDAVLTTANVKVDVEGFVDRDKMRVVFKESDFALSVPEMDGAPLSLMEAMTGSCFPIVSKLDANKEILKEGHAIYLDDYSYVGVKGVLHSCIEIINNEKNIEWLEENKKIVKRNYNYLNNTQLLRDVYVDFLSD